MLLLAVVAAAFGADDAEKLKGKAIALGREAEKEWKRYVLERPTFTDRDVDELIETYEQVIELFYKSLEVEEDASLNGQITVVARRLAKLRFEQMRRKRAKEKPKPKPKPKPEQPKPEEPKPESKPEPKPESKPEPEPEVEITRDSQSGWPILEEDKKTRNRGIQSLRNFIQHHYLAYRKFAALTERCSKCNGRGRIPKTRDPKTRQIIWMNCPRCDGAGGHLNRNAARRAYWLTMSPMYRADAGNRSAFFAKMDSWTKDPRTLGEFVERLSIKSIDYRGLWAVVKYEERGTALVNKRQRPFRRKVKRMFVRLGKRWFIYDEKSDKDWFTAGAD